jgi:hypothetical protein
MQSACMTLPALMPVAATTQVSDAVVAHCGRGAPACDHLLPGNVCMWPSEEVCSD